MDVFFIYGLVDSGEPDVIRYVGQTASLVKRWKQHQVTTGCCSLRESRWKWSVRFFGRRVEMRVLEVVYGTRDDAIARERWHIEKWQNGERLLNGHQQRAAFKRHGIHWRVQGAFHSSVMVLQEILAVKTLRNRRSAEVAAQVIDELETGFRPLMLCTADDCFYRRVVKVYERRQRRRVRATESLCK